MVRLCARDLWDGMVRMCAARAPHAGRKTAVNTSTSSWPSPLNLSPRRTWQLRTQAKSRTHTREDIRKQIRTSSTGNRCKRICSCSWGPPTLALHLQRRAHASAAHVHSPDDAASRHLPTAERPEIEKQNVIVLPLCRFATLGCAEWRGAAVARTRTSQPPWLCLVCSRASVRWAQ